MYHIYHNKWGGLMLRVFASILKGQRIKPYEWCCVVNNGMLTEYSPT
jgi:hypothetical protein